MVTKLSADDNNYANPRQNNEVIAYNEEIVIFNLSFQDNFHLRIFSEDNDEII